MQESEATLEQIVYLARNLSPLQKLQLIERLTPDLEAALQTSLVPQRRGLRGILAGCDIKSEDIDQARQDMWGNFSREDF